MAASGQAQATPRQCPWLTTPVPLRACQLVVAVCNPQRLYTWSTFRAPKHLIMKRMFISTPTKPHVQVLSTFVQKSDPVTPEEAVWLVYSL